MPSVSVEESVAWMPASWLHPTLSGKTWGLRFCHCPCGLQEVPVVTSLFWPQPGQKNTGLSGIFNLENS